MLKHQMFQQLHAAFLNGHMTTPSHDCYGHVLQIGGGLADLMASVSIQSWFILVVGNGLLHVSLKVMVFFY